MSESIEWIGGEHVLAKRAATPEIHNQIIKVCKDYEEHLKGVGQDCRAGQPTSGNKAGGLSTIDEKSLGCIRKGGTRPIVEVLEQACRPTKKGAIVMDTAGYDISSVTALFLGFVLMKLGEKGKPLLDLFRAGQKAMKEITNIVLEFTPFGVFGLMATVVGSNGAEILIPYIKTIAAMYIAGFIYVIVVQAFLMAGVIGGLNPLTFLCTMKEAMAFVFATCSSVATIPLNLKCTKNLGVDEDTANFVIPFCVVMNMNGTAIYEAVAVVFTAQIFGIDLSMTQQIMIMLTATLASIGTAGIPGSGLVMLTIVLSSVNLPMEAIGLLAGIDRILNMARVIPNIVGDAATAVVIARSEGSLKRA